MESSMFSVVKNYRHIWDFPLCWINTQFMQVRFLSSSSYLGGQYYLRLDKILLSEYQMLTSNPIVLKVVLRV